MSWWNRLAGLLHPRRLDAELDEELRHHLELRARAFVDQGLSPAEARRRAAIGFGSRARVQEECREIDRIEWMHTAWRDFRYAARSLARSPLFTATAVLSLILGIGANTAVFTLLYVSLWKPLPVRDPAQLVHLMRGNPAQPENEPNYSYPLFGIIAAAAQPDAEVTAKTLQAVRKFGMDVASTERVTGDSVAANYFSTLGVAPAAGRLFVPGDDSASGGTRVLVLSHAFWTRRFQADAGIVGQTVYYRETPYTVAGVAPPGFSGVDSEAAIDVWVPVTTDLPRTALAGHNYSALRLIARVRPGVDRARLQAVLDTTFRSYLETTILPHLPLYARPGAAAQRVTVRSAGAGFSTMGRRYQRPLLILLAVVALVLLIACANVANLVMARHSARRREIHVRLALGASVGRIAAQLFSESVLLCVAGAAGGVIVSVWSCRLLVSLLPGSASTLAYDFRPNPVVLGFTAVVALATAVLFGLAPAIAAARARRPLHGQPGARVTRGTPGARVLVAAQLALSLVLLIGAGLFMGTLRNLRTVDLGFSPERLTTFSVSFPRGTPAARIRESYARLRSHLADAPGVAGASFDTGAGWTATAEIDGRPPAAGEDNEVGVIAAGPDWFETLGLPLVAGRYLSERDAAETPPVAVVNVRLARKFFGNEPALGRRMVFHTGGDRPQLREIVGVVRDARHYGIKGREWPMVFIPTDREGGFLVRTASAGGITGAIREAVAAAGGGVQLESVHAYREGLEASLDRERLLAALTTAFGLLATLLAATGLYGVLAYGVAARTAELGIRMALGAQRREVQWMILREILRLVAAGSAAGLAGAWAATRAIGSMLYGIRPVDLPVFLGAAGVLALVAGLAAWIPARRASRIDPMVALRYE